MGDYWLTTLTAIQRGEPDWRAIAAYETPVRRFLHQRFGNLPAAERDDLLQEILLAMRERIVGSYLDLIDFVEATTRTDRLAVIDSISITTSHLGALDATIALRLFRNDRPADDLIARYVETRSDAVDEESQP